MLSHLEKYRSKHFAYCKYFTHPPLPSTLVLSHLLIRLKMMMQFCFLQPPLHLLPGQTGCPEVEAVFIFDFSPMRTLICPTLSSARKRKKKNLCKLLKIFCSRQISFHYFASGMQQTKYKTKQKKCLGGAFTPCRSCPNLDLFSFFLCAVN